jgi:hypothetical protein
VREYRESAASGCKAQSQQRRNNEACAHERYYPPLPSQNGDGRLQCEHAKGHSANRRPHLPDPRKSGRKPGRTGACSTASGSFRFRGEIPGHVEVCRIHPRIRGAGRICLLRCSDMLPWSGVVPGKDYHIEKVVYSDVAWNLGHRASVSAGSYRKNPRPASCATPIIAARTILGRRRDAGDPERRRRHGKCESRECAEHSLDGQALLFSIHTSRADTARSPTSSLISISARRAERQSDTRVNRLLESGHCGFPERKGRKPSATPATWLKLVVLSLCLPLSGDSRIALKSRPSSC